MAGKHDLSKYGPKVSTPGTIKVIVTGRLNVTSSDSRVSIERKE